MKKLLGILVLYLLWFIPVSADERFIPLELFTGGEIRDDIEIRFTPADKIFLSKFYNDNNLRKMRIKYIDYLNSYIFLSKKYIKSRIPSQVKTYIKNFI